MIKKLHFILLLLCIMSAPFISLAQTQDSVPEKPPVLGEDRAPSFFNNIISNPAYTGIFGGHNILVNAGIDKPFFTFRNLYHSQYYNAAYDVAFGKKRNNAIGVYYSDMKGGILSSKTIGVNYARSFNLTQDKKFYQKLRVGVSIGEKWIVSDWNRVSFGDMIDPAYGFMWNTSEMRSEPLRKDINFELGAWYQNPVFYFGIGTKNLTEPDEANYGVSLIPRELNVSTGGKIKICNNFAIHPSLCLSYISRFKGKLSSLSPSITGSFKNNYFLGLSYKDLNKITAHAGVIAFNCVSLSVAYGISKNTDLEGFGYPAYIGGDLRINIKN